jgi:alpha-glucosidase
MTVGEAPFSHSASDLAEYVLPANKELNMVFQFEMMDIDSATVLEPLIPKKWVLSDLKDVVEKWQTFERDRGFWNSCVSFFLFFVFAYEIMKLTKLLVQCVHRKSRSVSCSLALRQRLSEMAHPVRKIDLVVTYNSRWNLVPIPRSRNRHE